MVLIEHVGFGGRDRQLWLYWWDERDGPEWSGWWMTPDYVGNNEFILHEHSAATTPADAPVGSWRSPMVEEQQLKRQLQIGFKVAEGTDGVLHIVGPDAETPFMPDGVCKFVLGKMEFRPDGLNHGKISYQAFERKVPPAEPMARSGPPAWQPAVAYIAIGLAVGVSCTLALSRRP